MEANKKVDQLLGLLNEQIDSFQARRLRDKGKAFRFRMFQASASASVVVLLGLNIRGLGGDALAQEVVTSFALIVSATATVMAAWDAFYDHRELWVRYTGVVGALRSIRNELLYVTANGTTISDDHIDSLFLRFQDALDRAHESWQELRSSAPTTGRRSAVTPQGGGSTLPP